MTILVNAGDFSTEGVFDASLVATSGTSQLSWYGRVWVFSVASAGDLASLSSVRRALGGSFRDETYTTFDDELSRLIGSVSAEIRRMTGQALNVPAASVTERRNGDGTSRMLLNESPAVSVSSVTVDGEAIPAQTSVTGDGFFLDADCIELVGYTFTSGRGNVSIVYTSGWSTVPEDLEDAVVQLVALKFARNSAPGQASVAVGGDSISYDSGAAFANAMAIVSRITGRVPVA